MVCAPEMKNENKRKKVKVFFIAGSFDVYKRFKIIKGGNNGSPFTILSCQAFIPGKYRFILTKTGADSLHSRMLRRTQEATAYSKAFLTTGAIRVPKISMDFINDACDGPPTSICAEKRVSPNCS